MKKDSDLYMENLRYVGETLEDTRKRVLGKRRLRKIKLARFTKK